MERQEFELIDILRFVFVIEFFGAPLNISQSAQLTLTKANRLGLAIETAQIS